MYIRGKGVGKTGDKETNQAGDDGVLLQNKRQYGERLAEGNTLATE